MNEDMNEDMKNDTINDKADMMSEEQTDSPLLLVPTKVLLLIAGAVWFIAGAVVASVGVKASTQPWTWPMVLGLLVVFAIFLVVFLFISYRHIRRILSYTSKLSFLFRFFNASSYMIMVVMIFLGATVRISTFVPDSIIAFFYSGLGAALILAGLYLVISYIRVWESPRFQQ